MPQTTEEREDLAAIHVSKTHREALLCANAGVGLLVACGYEIVEPFGEESKTADQWLTCFKWAAITLIVLTAPVLGKVTQVSFERTIGTVAGGLLGLVTVLLGREMMQVTDQAFTAVVSGLVGFGAVVAGHKLGMDYAGRLLAMTFILVIIGVDGRSDAFLVALTRCSGIILGVLVSILLAILVFPKSASHQATDNLASALEGLCMLAKLAWNAPYRGEEGDEAGGECYVPLEDGLLTGGSPGDAEAREAECEKVLMEVYNSLTKVDEFLPLSRRERYMFTFRGRWCFLPAIPLLPLGNWVVPAKPMQELAAAIRRVSRVLWALHVTFQEGFNEEVICILRKRYPADLLATLQSQSYGALREVCDAFPDDSILPNAKLKRFLEAVKELIRVSNQHRRFVVGSIVGSAAVAAEVQAASSSLMEGGGVAGTAPTMDEWDTGSKEVAGPTVGGGMTDATGDWLAVGTSTDEITFGEEDRPRLSVDQVETFPLTEQGYISKTRWYAFQFMMQELADDLEAMHRCMATVLKMLPNALAARHV